MLPGFDARSLKKDSKRFVARCFPDFMQRFLLSAAAAQARSALNAAEAGANSDITSLPALVTVPTVVANAIVVASPVGSVFFMAGNSPPSGTLAANGSLLSRTTYANLWAFAQTSGMLVAEGSWTGGQFSTGDGSTTFRLPDGRGEFFRGWDNGRGIDAGRGLGTNQAQSVKSEGFYEAGASGTSKNVLEGLVAKDNRYTGTTVGSLGTETRPRNIALLACIRY